jgi:peptidoglycan hydrolase-like protein with peptidoglycan-binding domain
MGIVIKYLKKTKMGKIKLTEKQYSKLKDNLIESVILNEQSTNEVRDIQSKLNKCFNAGLSVDGICGPKTNDAIKKFLGIRTWQI